MDTQFYEHTLRICNTFWFSIATMATRTPLPVMSYVLCPSCLNLISICLRFQGHKHPNMQYVRHRAILLPNSVWQCSQGIEMGWTCNKHEQNEKHKLHSTKQKKRAKLGDTAVDGIMLKCATLTAGSCRLGMDYTGSKSLVRSDMVSLNFHKRRYKAQRLGRSAVTGRSTDASRRQMRESTFEPGTFGVRTKSIKHCTRRPCGHRPCDKPRTVRIAVSEGI